MEKFKGLLEAQLCFSAAMHKVWRESVLLRSKSTGMERSVEKHP